MKKLSLIIAVLLTSLFSYAQLSRFSIYKLEFGHYNATRQDYKDDAGEKFPDRMYVTYQNSIFLVTDEAKSTYTVKSFLEEKSKECNVYSGEDEEDRKVVIMLCAYPKSGILTVVYPNFYYISYYLKSIE